MRHEGSLYYSIITPSFCCKNRRLESCSIMMCSLWFCTLNWFWCSFIADSNVWFTDLTVNRNITLHQVANSTDDSVILGFWRLADSEANTNCRRNTLTWSSGLKWLCWEDGTGQCMFLWNANSYVGASKTSKSRSSSSTSTSSLPLEPQTQHKFYRL